MTHVASVAGRPIERSRLEERLRRFREGPGGRHVPPDAHGGELTSLRRWLLQDLLTEAVLIEEAHAAGLMPLDDDGEEQAVPDPMVVRALFERVTAAVHVEAEDVWSYYERNIDRYRTAEARRIRHSLTRDETDAPTRDEAGALTRDADARDQAAVLELRRGEFAGPLEEAVFAAQPGEVVGPIESELGWHVVHVDAVIPERTLPFDEVRDDIEAELLAAARGRVFAEWLDRRRHELASVEPGWEHPADPVHGVISHRH